MAPWLLRYPMCPKRALQFSLIKLHLASLPLASSYSRVAVSSAQTRGAPLRKGLTGQTYPLNVQSFPYFLLLVDYDCFRLTSGGSTAVGLCIVHRNRKRFLLSQSMLREEFVEKKY